MFIKFTAVVALLASLAAAAPCNGKAEVVETCKNSGQVALTFDDGPYMYEAAVSSALAGGKGTFFLNGNNYDCIYDRVDEIRALHAAGHTLGSHTWSHADLTKLDYNGINEELKKVEDAFIRILGLRPLYFRPPFGNYNDLVLQVLRDRGYAKLVMWDSLSSDSVGASVSAQKKAMDDVVNAYPSPRLPLLHSTIAATSQQVLPYIVPKLKAKGYQLVSVDTCLGSSGEWPYAYVGQPGLRDGNWKC